jgi:hypothetical protein
MRNKQCQLRTGRLYAVLNRVTTITLDKTSAVSGQIANQGLFVGDREYECAAYRDCARARESSSDDIKPLLLHLEYRKTTCNRRKYGASQWSELHDAEAAATSISRRILAVKAASPSQFGSAFATRLRAGVGALLVGSGPLFTSQRARLVVLSARHAIPTSYVDREFAVAGGLMSYGPSQTDAYRRAGIYAARILKGEKPGDLPVDQPTKFELVINLGTAAALGIRVPAAMQLIADEVIE